MNRSRIYSFVTNAAYLAAYWLPGCTHAEVRQRRLAGRLVALCAELGMDLNSVVDVGARESELTGWLVQRWPELKVRSFEPDLRHMPAGDVFRVALSDQNGSGTLEDAGGTVCPYIIPSNDEAQGVPVRRYDALTLLSPMPHPCLLKVDAETHTLKALKGFGAALQTCDLLLVEVANCFPDQPHMKHYCGTVLSDIVQVAAKAGFVKSRALCTGAAFADRIQHMDVAFWK